LIGQLGEYPARALRARAPSGLRPSAHLNAALDIRMKQLLTFFFVALVSTAQAGASNDLARKVWNHGSVDCDKNQDPPVEVYRFDIDTYILRQSKCIHFEAPFIYVLFGDHTVFVQDTGATADPSRFPLYETVRSLVAQRNHKEINLLVTHSHSHSDHTAADDQFRNKPGVTLIEPSAKAVREHFGFSAWPEGSASLDLGSRTLEVFPIPGHQKESIAIYDPRTGWLLTGDTLYPGRLYVTNWGEYRSSVERLVAFSKTRRISAVLGTHIEISNSGSLFEAGSTFQPDEATLALAADDLLHLDQALRDAGVIPREIVTDRFAVVPIGTFWRAVDRLMRWLGAR
jgi:hydroxyacylglutathione hydrolase